VLPPPEVVEHAETRAGTRVKTASQGSVLAMRADYPDNVSTRKQTFTYLGRNSSARAALHAARPAPGGYSSKLTLSMRRNPWSARPLGSNPLSSSPRGVGVKTSPVQLATTAATVAGSFSIPAG
jgi:hypothetical protein